MAVTRLGGLGLHVGLRVSDSDNHTSSSWFIPSHSVGHVICMACVCAVKLGIRDVYVHDSVNLK